MRIWEIGQLAGRRLRDRAHPHLQDLFDLTHENVHLAIRDGLQALYVDKVYGSRRVSVASRIGGRVPLHSTAVGRVLLAAQADWFVEAYLAKELDAPSPYTVTDHDHLLRIVQAVRTDGYAVTVEQMRVGALSIAVPIHFEDQVVASVAIVFDATRVNEIKRHIPLVRGTAERIEAAMVGVPMRWSRPTR
jgi:DNA-binding IclR family transcriptional regulator